MGAELKLKAKAMKWLQRKRRLVPYDEDGCVDVMRPTLQDETGSGSGLRETKMKPATKPG